MHNGTKQRPQMYTIRNPLYYLRNLVLASKVERLSVWNAVHLVHFSPLLDYCPIWFFSKKKKISNLVHFSLFWSNSVQFGQFGQFNQFQSILVHFGPILSTLVYFCPHRSIQAHSVHYDALRSNSFHFCPFWSTLVHFRLNLYFGPFWFNSIHFDSFLSTFVHSVHFGLFRSL